MAKRSERDMMRIISLGLPTAVLLMSPILGIKVIVPDRLQTSILGIARIDFRPSAATADAPD